MQKGFTIVELLIVIVVIAILAAVTIVAYNGIRDRATASSVQSAVAQAKKKIMTYAVEHADMYPDTLAEAGVSDTGSIAYQYTSDNSSDPKTYAITASNGVAGPVNYFASTSQPAITQGIAPGHNLIRWNEVDGVSAPIELSGGVVVDTSVARSGSASIRIMPNNTGVPLRGTPYEGLPGQVQTVSFWLRSDPDWNGINNNSKIRFGSVPNANLLSVCSYGGVKINWTFITCSRTLTEANSATYITVGNDGSVGNIWIDDVSYSIR